MIKDKLIYQKKSFGISKKIIFRIKTSYFSDHKIILCQRIETDLYFFDNSIE
jgi:hypothetical protein